MGWARVFLVKAGKRPGKTRCGGSSEGRVVSVPGKWLWKGSTTTFGVPPLDADGGAGQAAQEPMALAALQTSVCLHCDRCRNRGGSQSAQRPCRPPLRVEAEDACSSQALGGRKKQLTIWTHTEHSVRFWNCDGSCVPLEFLWCNWSPSLTKRSAIAEDQCKIWLRPVVGRTGPGRLYHEGLILFLSQPSSHYLLP